MHRTNLRNGLQAPFQGLLSPDFISDVSVQDSSEMNYFSVVLTLYFPTYRNSIKQVFNHFQNNYEFSQLFLYSPCPPPTLPLPLTPTNDWRSRSISLPLQQLPLGGATLRRGLLSLAPEEGPAFIWPPRSLPGCMGMVPLLMMWVLESGEKHGEKSWSHLEAEVGNWTSTFWQKMCNSRQGCSEKWLKDPIIMTSIIIHSVLCARLV